jgi:hypothetical protein
MIIVVDTLQDENDGIMTGGVSLREAINRANTLPGRDLIRFNRSLQRGTIALTTGEPLDISDDLRIVGLGANKITIDGNGVNVFEVNDGSEEDTIRVAIEKISIVNGNTGINNQEELTIVESKISGSNSFAINSAISRNNRFYNSTLNILNSSISNNYNIGINS